MATTATNKPSFPTADAFAKINLTLEVLGARSDGYHALRSVVMPVSLADSLSFVAADSFSVDTGYPDDLCLRAAQVLREAAGEGVRPSFAIHVTKRIPPGGGLGGGSADAAAVLRWLNVRWGLDWELKRLAEIGARVGSDVPALVLAAVAGPVMMEGRGEFVRPLLANCDGVRLPLVLANPGVFSSTPEVFRACAVERPAEDTAIADAMTAAIASGEPHRIAAAMTNDLEGPAVGLHPEIGAALAALREEGTIGAMMSGSGSSVFGFADTAESAVRIAASLTARGLKAWPLETVCPTPKQSRVNP